MRARQKLNEAYFMGSLLLAGFFGALTQSWPVFVVTLLFLVGCNCYFGEIRVAKHGR